MAFFCTFAAIKTKLAVSMTPFNKEEEVINTGRQWAFDFTKAVAIVSI